MTSQPTALTLDGGAAAIGADLEALRATIAEAVQVAETPTAKQCTMPGPALQVRIELGGRMLVATREQPDSDAWLVELI